MTKRRREQRNKRLTCHCQLEEEVETLGRHSRHTNASLNRYGASAKWPCAEDRGRCSKRGVGSRILPQIAALRVANPRERFTELLPVPRLQEPAEVVNNIVKRTELSLSTGPITAEMQACADAVCQDLLRVGAGYRGALGRRAFDVRDEARLCVVPLCRLRLSWLVRASQRYKRRCATRRK